MRIFAYVLVLAVFVASAAAQGSETLAGILRDHSVPTAGLASDSLQQAVGNYALRPEGAHFTIAYYTSPEDSSPLWIRSYDKQKHRWLSKSFGKGVGVPLGTNDVCLGSIEALDLIGAHWVVRTHINPSAECTIVFSPTLDLERAIYGWIVSTTRSNISLIQHSEVHFAPTHPVELSVYDYSENTLVQIFPPKDDLLRNEFITYLSAHRDLDWCRENNSHCDPERFGAELGDVRAGIESDSFAFYITFSSEGYGASASDQRELMYVFRRRGREWEYREYTKESAPYTLNEAVSPYTLPHVFEYTHR